MRLIDAVIVVIELNVAMTLTIELIYRASRRQVLKDKHHEASLQLPAGWVLGWMESFFFFAVLSIQGMELLAGAWLAFKLATRWESSKWSKPSSRTVRVGYRAFQVGTLGNLLIGVIGAAVFRFG